MVRARKAFTTVELLVVIGILILLIAVVVVGLGRLAGGARTQATGLAMETLKSMLEEYQATQKPRSSAIVNLTDGIYPPPPRPPLPAPGDVSAEAYETGAEQPQYGRRGEAVTLTREVMKRLLTVAGNRQKVERLPSNSVMDYDGVPIVLDGWGNPIIFVPPEGLQIENSASVLLRLITAGGERPFFASAGEDGRFQDRRVGVPDQQVLAASDDNIYSFEN